MARVSNLDKDLQSPIKVQIQGKVSEILLKWSHALKMLTAGRLTAGLLTRVLGSEETASLQQRDTQVCLPRARERPGDEPGQDEDPRPRKEIGNLEEKGF